MYFAFHLISAGIDSSSPQPHNGYRGWNDKAAVGKCAVTNSLYRPLFAILLPLSIHVLFIHSGV